MTPPTDVCRYAMCPTCNALPGYPCASPMGLTMRTVHDDRPVIRADDSGTGTSGEKFVASDPSQAATYWQARALRAEAKLAEFDATLTEGEAWAQAREDGLT